MKITPIAIISQLAAITTAVQQDCHSIGYTIDGCGALGGERSTWKCKPTSDDPYLKYGPPNNRCQFMQADYNPNPPHNLLDKIYCCQFCELVNGICPDAHD
ncbi:hypothetical protein ACJQWK_06238 [Exserohilum turcicum]